MSLTMLLAAHNWERAQAKKSPEKPKAGHTLFPTRSEQVWSTYASGEAARCMPETKKERAYATRMPTLEHFTFETLLASARHSSEKRGFLQNPRHFVATAAFASAEQFQREIALGNARWLHNWLRQARASRPHMSMEKALRRRNQKG